VQKIHVLLKKEELDAQRLEGKVVVVLDILFATSSIVTALAHGATEVIPTLDGRAAQEAAKAFPAGSYVLSGELNADTLPGFVHPTPQALLAEGIAGRRLIYCTTNGTVALAKSQGAAHVYAAALLNGRAVVERIAAQHPDSTILIVCSGSADNFNLEDFYGAGYLVSLFRRAVSGCRLLRCRTRRGTAARPLRRPRRPAPCPRRPHDAGAPARRGSRLRRAGKLFRRHTAVAGRRAAPRLILQEPVK
jgi:2-phosphosulfolactate phosphatase